MRVMCFFCRENLDYPGEECVVVGFMWTGDDRDPMEVEDAEYQQAWCHRSCMRSGVR